MRSRNTIRILSMTLMLCLAGVVGAGQPSAATRPAPETVSIALLHVNDSHGQIQSRTVGGISVGGYARLATRVQQIRQFGKYDRVLLLHAGDIFSRGDALTRRTLGAANVELMNHLRFDIWTPGNGEFYDGAGNLQARIEQSTADVLAANVKLRRTGKHLAKPYVIKQVGPVRVALFGLCMVRTKHPSAKPLLVAGHVETARRLVAKLRKQADVVVAVTHLGHHIDLRLARQVPGIDVIVGGHSHSKVEKGVVVKRPGGTTLVCQAGDRLRWLGQVELKLTRRDGRFALTSARAKLLPIDANTPEDPTVKALIARLAQAKTPTEVPVTAK